MEISYSKPSSHKEMRQELFKNLTDISGMEYIGQSKNTFIGSFSQDKFDTEIKGFLFELNIYYQMIFYSDFVLMYFGWLSMDHLSSKVKDKLVEHFFNFEPSKSLDLIGDIKNCEYIKKNMINMAINLRKIGIISDVFIDRFITLINTIFTEKSLSIKHCINEIQKQVYNLSIKEETAPMFI
jgi:hypothetical protein